jgi:hypothetical protein
LAAERLLAEGHFIGASSSRARFFLFLIKAVVVGESSAPAVVVSGSTTGPEEHLNIFADFGSKTDSESGYLGRFSKPAMIPYITVGL